MRSRYIHLLIYFVSSRVYAEYSWSRCREPPKQDHLRSLSFLFVHLRAPVEREQRERNEKAFKSGVGCRLGKHPRKQFSLSVFCVSLYSVTDHHYSLIIKRVVLLSLLIIITDTTTKAREWCPSDESSRRRNQ